MIKMKFVSVEKVDPDLYEVRDDRGNLMKSFLGPNAHLDAQRYALTHSPGVIES